MRKVKIHWPNGSAGIEDYDDQVQRGFYLAELSCWFLADFVAQSWVDAVQTAELIVMQQEKRRAADDEPTNKLQQVREWPRCRAYCILHNLSSKDQEYGA